MVSERRGVMDSKVQKQISVMDIEQKEGGKSFLLPELNGKVSILPGDGL
jgi:hypothetical protein